MIKMRMPAISATMAGMWAVVMVMKFLRNGLHENSNRDLHFIALRGSTIGDARTLGTVPAHIKMPKIAAYEAGLFWNDAARDELADEVGRHPSRKEQEHAEQNTCSCSDRRR